jgi:hypothetical protein
LQNFSETAVLDTGWNFFERTPCQRITAKIAKGHTTKKAKAS